MKEKVTFFLQVSSADNRCKQFGPRSGLTKYWAESGSTLFDIQMVFLKQFFEKDDFEKTYEKLPSLQS